MLIADRYELSGNSYVGGMAKVLLCKDTTLERRVAIKIMPGSASRRRVRDEISALLKMRSKHVVQVYDILNVGVDDLAIVQELIDGKDLFDAGLAPGTAAEYLRMIWQIASGISDIHDIDVIHRDIKPNNMKMDPEGVIKIFDFGLARDEGDGASTVGFIGTRGFAAPELYAHKVNFTAAVDTFAFGSTALYVGLQGLPDELLSQPPVAMGENYFSRISFGLAQEVVDVLNSCLELDPARRPLMKKVRDVLAKHLLFDRHKALVVFNGQPSYLHSTNRSVNLRLPSMGEISIQYDGFDFLVQSQSGDVFVNNQRVAVGDKLPGACVVALGAPDKKNLRRYITFDLSHPEIVL